MYNYTFILVDLSRGSLSGKYAFSRALACPSVFLFSFVIFLFRLSYSNFKNPNSFILSYFICPLFSIFHSLFLFPFAKKFFAFFFRRFLFSPFFFRENETKTGNATNLLTCNYLFSIIDETSNPLTLVKTHKNYGGFNE